MKIIRAMVCFFLAVSTIADAQPQQGVLFTNVMVWDGTSEALRKADVLITGNTISKISDEPLAVIQSTDMTVIDCGGRTLMPELLEEWPVESALVVPMEALPDNLKSSMGAHWELTQKNRKALDERNK